MDELYGYAGRLLRVDLTGERTTDEKMDSQTARQYLGGTGIGAKILYEEVPPGVEWSDPDNRLIIASGPLGGTSIEGSGTISVVTKGPMTNGGLAAQANGMFGAFLRLSGYDGLVLQGRAKRWVYLYIHDGRAEIGDASHLAGKDTWETGDAIRAELGCSEQHMSVASIGPAGENLVRFSGIFVDRGHAAGHGGPGAVMGSKKLKAIAVARGRLVPAFKDEQGISAIAKQFHTDTLNNPAEKEGHYGYGTLNSLRNHTLANEGIVPVRNYTTTIYDIEPDKLEKFSGAYIRSHFNPRPNPCWRCSFHHGYRITITEEPFKGHDAIEPEYECLAACGPLIGVTDVTAAIVLANEVDRMGLEANETGWTIGLAIECFEKGLLTLKDTGGVALTWGNYESALEMIRNMAARRGFGKVLAEGAMRAAQHIGGDAPKFAVHTMKGNTPRGHDHRQKWPMLFDTCVAEMANDEGFTIANPADIGLSIKPSKRLAISPEDTLLWNVKFKGGDVFVDSLGVCRHAAKTDLKLHSQAVSAATGWDFTAQEAMDAGMRAVTLFRAFNIKHGHTAEMDAPSPRYGSAPTDGPARGQSIMSHFDELRRKYYDQMGWDVKTGKPLPGTLRRFGLGHVVPDLWSDETVA
ncbi:MAG: hypothetical protein HYY32_06360 [Chloroflexi bacterium]|nr:hypothetical protein [Chloroflexota bacterium]